MKQIVRDMIAGRRSLEVPTDRGQFARRLVVSRRDGMRELARSLAFRLPLGEEERAELYNGGVLIYPFAGQ